MADAATATQPARLPHVVLFPTPGMGHLIPLAEFAKRLLSEFSFTFAVPTDGPPSSGHRSFLSSLPAGIDYVFLPPADLSDAPADAKIETIISLTASRSLPSLRRLISDLPNAVALVVDLFGTDAFDLASELGLHKYIFFPSTATCLSLFLHLENLDGTVSSEYADLAEPIRIPGCVPLHGKDLLDPVQDRKNDAYKWLLHHAKRYKLSEGIMVNSFETLEKGPIRELLRPGPGRPVVYPVGPLIQQNGSVTSVSDPSGCVKWLDDQPRGSVLFVNFGSGGTLTTEQQNELAWGLEKSGQRFLWVIRTANDSVSNATYFTLDGQPDPIKTLPEGFLERVSGRGLGFIVPKWAPQIGVLSHRATGGFLSHCGWNSTLESVVHGVALITWPLYAEQRMNAVMLTEELGVGLRPVAGPDGVVRSDEIARVVKELTDGDEGKKIRARMEELKEAAEVALSRDGSSTMALKEIARKWKI